MESIFNLQADRILSQEEAKKYDSLFATQPFLQIEIQDIAKKTFGLKIYPPQGKNKLVVAKMNEESILLQPQAAALVMRRREYFVMK